MGKKEKIQKELDLILEKLRFWRYVIFGIVSAVIGVIYNISQNKTYVNIGIIILLFLSFLGIILSITRINSLTKKYYYFLSKLEKEE